MPISAAQRAAKRFARENRSDKGVSTEAKRQAKNAAIRKARESFNFNRVDDPFGHYALLAAALTKGKR